MGKYTEVSPVDHHVGRRLRLRRMTLDMTQEKLATELEVSYQQVQKYEHGTNRIGAGRLFILAQLLGVSVQYFFEGLEEDDTRREELSYVSTAEGLALNEAFCSIASPEIRRQLVSLISSISSNQAPG